MFLTKDKIQLFESRVFLEHLNQLGMQSVVFSIDHQIYSVLIEQIVEIVRVPIITSVPGIDPIIEGVINLRGNIIPVVNLHRRFQLPIPEKHKKNRIVIVDVNGENIGLIVEEVKMVTTFDEEDIEPPHHQAIDEDVFTSFAKYEGQVIGVLNLHKVLYHA